MIIILHLTKIQKNSSNWWRRKYINEYIPVLDSKNTNIQQILKNYGWDKTMKHKNKITIISTLVKTIRHYTSNIDYYLFVTIIIALLLPVLLLK